MTVLDSNLHYVRPRETVHAQGDLHLLHSPAILAFLATCMVMCDLWFLVNELSKELERQARTDPLTRLLSEVDSAGVRRELEGTFTVTVGGRQPNDTSENAVHIQVLGEVTLPR